MNGGGVNLAHVRCGFAGGCDDAANLCPSEFHVLR
jgi:hypothetical protein